jgi:hypothetical protein
MFHTLTSADPVETCPCSVFSEYMLSSQRNLKPVCVNSGDSEQNRLAILDVSIIDKSSEALGDLALGFRIVAPSEAKIPFECFNHSKFYGKG